MIAVLKEYIKIRIDLIKLIGLTILMTILVLSTGDAGEVWIYSMLFLASSFTVFRVFDDAFSVVTDRKEHPERTYLIPQKFKSFKIITSVILGAYLLSIKFLFSDAFLIILLLLISSLVFYLLLRKQLIMLKLIPSLKYPILLYCTSMISSNEVELGILFSSFLLILGFDSFDIVKKQSNNIWKPMFFLFCCSILLFKPWLNYNNILFSIFPLFIIYLIRNKRGVQYFSILYLPIMYFILTNL
ncbi:hypothetical protein [Aestuariivivens insulae]|uniref:hypothetical protein n=1 Tax=Aestuariivivens insulae TaxID=1621988 RepID=UPI001F57FC06|nr:hypothetical protein [Aestuariivivens insulae]